MIEIDVGQDRAVQRELQMCAVTFVGLDDEPLTARPLGAGSHVVHIAADHETRTKPGLSEDQHEHRCGGGLAVGARHRH